MLEVFGGYAFPARLEIVENRSATRDGLAGEEFFDQPEKQGRVASLAVPEYG